MSDDVCVCGDSEDDHEPDCMVDGCGCVHFEAEESR